MPVYHILIALGAQVGVGLLTGNWLAGGLAGAAIFIGREHAQAEYRWIERYGFGRRINMPWWGGFDPKVWNLHSLTDWVCPLVAVSMLGALV